METPSEALVRETIQAFGSVVAPSLAVSEVTAYLLIPGSGSRYRVWLQDGSKLECSAAGLKALLREDIAEEALA